MARGRKPKGKYADLSDDWKSEQMALSEDGVRKSIAQIALHLVALEAAKKLDADLLRLREELKAAGAVYAEGKKDGSQKLNFLREVLESRGIPVPTIDDFIKEAAEESA